MMGDRTVILEQREDMRLGIDLTSERIAIVWRSVISEKIGIATEVVGSFTLRRDMNTPEGWEEREDGTRVRAWKSRGERRRALWGIIGPKVGAEVLIRDFPASVTPTYIIRAELPDVTFKDEAGQAGAARLSRPLIVVIDRDTGESVVGDRMGQVEYVRWTLDGPMVGVRMYAYGHPIWEYKPTGLYVTRADGPRVEDEAGRR